MVETISMSIYFSALALLMAANKSATPYPPANVATGADSMVEKRSIELETSAEEWAGVWQRHKVGETIGTGNNLTINSAEQVPTIDFSQYEVLTLFGGLAPQGGYRIVESFKTLRQITVRITPLSTSLNGRAGPRMVNANPYLFAVFKKTKLPFVIQVQSANQDGVVEWSTVGKVGGS